MGFEINLDLVDEVESQLGCSSAGDTRNSSAHYDHDGKYSEKELWLSRFLAWATRICPELKKPKCALIFVTNIMAMWKVQQRRPSFAELKLVLNNPYKINFGVVWSPINPSMATAKNKLWGFWYKWEGGNGTAGNLVPMYIRSWTAFGNLDDNEVIDHHLYHSLDMMCEYEPTMFLVMGKYRNASILKRNCYMTPERMYAQGGGHTSLRYGRGARDKQARRRTMRGSVVNAICVDPRDLKQTGKKSSTCGWYVSARKM